MKTIELLNNDGYRSRIIEILTEARMPRMTTAERDNLKNHKSGMLIFNTTTSKFQGYDGTSWVDLN